MDFARWHSSRGVKGSSGDPFLDILTVFIVVRDLASIVPRGKPFACWEIPRPRPDRARSWRKAAASFAKLAGLGAITHPADNPCWPFPTAARDRSRGIGAPRARTRADGNSGARPRRESRVCRAASRERRSFEENGGDHFLGEGGMGPDSGGLQRVTSNLDRPLVRALAHGP